MGGGLRLSRLSSAKGLTLPKVIGGDLDLTGLYSREGLMLPERVDGTVRFFWMSNSDVEALMAENPHLHFGS
jgi:hypothetical protein